MSSIDLQMELGVELELKKPIFLNNTLNLSAASSALQVLMSVCLCVCVYCQVEIQPFLRFPKIIYLSLPKITQGDEVPQSRLHIVTHGLSRLPNLPQPHPRLPTVPQTFLRFTMEGLPKANQK